MVKRKNCIKETSYNCGATCISGKKVCNVDGLQGQSVSILSRLKEAVKTVSTDQNKPKTNKIEVTRGEVVEDEWGEQRAIISKVGGNTVESQAITDRSGQHEINFSINGRLDRDNTLDESVRRRIAKVVLSDMKKLFSSFDEGEVFYNSPYETDGLGQQRKNLYEKFGFSKADESGIQYATKKRGKIVPSDMDGNILKFAEIEPLVFSTTDEELEKMIFQLV